MQELHGIFKSFCCLCVWTLPISNPPSPSPSHAPSSLSRQLMLLPVLSFMPQLCSHPFTDSPRKEVYFMAIIDILTHYDAKKKAAHAAKTVKHGVSISVFFLLCSWALDIVCSTGTSSRLLLSTVLLQVLQWVSFPAEG